MPCPESPPPATFAFVSLGCPKNLIDSERALAHLTSAGLVPTDDPAEARAIIINTCGFIRDAIEESSEVIEQALSLKEQEPTRRVVVVGCLTERFGREDLEILQGVDALFGVLGEETAASLTDYLLREFGGTGATDQRDRPDARATLRELDPFTRLRITAPHYGYLRVALGCANRCRYCVIPDIRGPLRSRPAEELVAEAEHLVADGVVELCLVAEDTTSYGRDWDGESHLPVLIRRLAGIDGLHWVRLLYTHPAHFDNKLIEVLATEPKVCRYVDLPIQHASDRILEAMGRGVTQEDIRALVARLRDALPGLMLRTSVIVGFPGETDTELQELLDFLREVRFERLGAFTYSHEPGTPAFDFPDQVPEEERESRRRAVMELQQEIAFEFNSSLLQRRLPAIVDAAAGPDEHRALGRTYGDAPDVDGTLYLRGERLLPGEIWEVRVVGTEGYDLEGAVEYRLHSYQA